MKQNTPVDEMSEKCFVTFALFAYNQEKYIREAVEGALAQTYAPLEIIFSDDCSSDRTFELIEEMLKDYRGPHQIRLNRNQKNLGLIEHVNKLFEISAGDFIVAAAGDDISSPDRVSCMMDAYRQNGQKALVIHSCAIKIDDSSEELEIFIPPAIRHSMTLIDMADSRSLYIGATGGWSRSLYRDFGPIVYRNAYEDLVFGFRAAIKDSLVYVDKPLVRYRVNTGITAKTNTPIWRFSARKSARINSLKTTLDVLEQRLRDLGCMKNLDEASSLKARLSKNIRFHEMRLFFYNNPLTLVPQVFSKDFIHVLRALNSETKYLFGLNDCSIT